MGTYTKNSRNVASRPRSARLRDTTSAATVATTSGGGGESLWDADTTVGSDAEDIRLKPKNEVRGILLTNGTDNISIHIDDNGNLRVSGNVLAEGDVMAYASASATVEDFISKLQQALGAAVETGTTAIDNAKSDALSKVNTAKSNALNDVSDAASDALDDIEDARSTAVSEISAGKYLPLAGGKMTGSINSNIGSLNSWSTSTNGAMIYHSLFGNANGLFRGAADSDAQTLGANGSANIVLKSWNGIGFGSSQSGEMTVGIAARSGNIHTAGTIKADSSITGYGIYSTGAAEYAARLEVNCTGSNGVIYQRAGNYGWAVSTRYNDGTYRWWVIGGNNVMTLTRGGMLTLSSTLTQNSDVRLKKNIRPLMSRGRVRPVAFVMKDDEEQRPRIGFVAQEMEKVYPELVATDNETGMKSVDYASYTAVLQAQVDALESRLARAEEIIRTLMRGGETYYD